MISDQVNILPIQICFWKSIFPARHVQKVKDYFRNLATLVPSC